MTQVKSNRTEDILLAWRTKSLNTLITILVFVAVPTLVFSVTPSINTPENQGVTVIFWVTFIILLILAVFRRINNQVRAGVLLILGYILVTVTLSNYGFNSSGPLYALVLPVLALIMIGPRAGVLAALLSILEEVILCVLIEQGVLVTTPRPSSLWVPVSTFGMLLAGMMVILILFFRFQIKIMENQRRTAIELETAHSLVEMHNRTLEERVAQRTAELEQSTYALQESHRRLADIINFLPDAVLVIDQNSRVSAWNHAMQEMTGIPAEKMLGKGDHEYSLPFYGKHQPILIDLVTQPQEELEQSYTAIRRKGEVLIGETYVPKLKGKDAYLYATAAPLRDSHGIISGAIEVIRDFTERKRMEEDLQRAKETAEAATQAKSAFLATMSHEIRTPMNAIIGMSGLLLDTQLSADQREFTETIRNSSDALLTIINDILDFSKIEAGKMELERQPFDLRECVESALDLTKIRAAEKKLELACEFMDGVPNAILGDVTRLRQVLVNLLTNAVKFTDTGEVIVSVKLAPGSPAAAVDTMASIHFSVCDTGIGIPIDRQNRLFQAFSQVDSSTTRKFGGTGLGLAVSKRLCEIMGGTLWVESTGTPGQGSTFHFTIQAMVTQIQTRLPDTTPELRGKSVLIVDDNATNRRILNLQAQGWGMRTRDTGLVSDALEWVGQGETFDLAIIDLQMPEMDGIELAEKIRSTASKLPLVLLSSLGSFGKAIPQGLFTACLTKPIRASALFDALMGIVATQPVPLKVKTPTLLDPKMAQRLPLRILLADDYVVNQKVALRMLSQMGYRADVAANGLEAIQAVERQPYDVVLMDVQMPEMDGLDATRQICSTIPQTQRPRIIAMTANAMQGDREICIRAGMDDYISKPIRVEELIEALERCQTIH